MILVILLFVNVVIGQYSICLWECLSTCTAMFVILFWGPAGRTVFSFRGSGCGCAIVQLLGWVGFMFRGGLGLQFKLTKTILPIVEMTYSYQNIYKTFKDSNRNDNFYTLESIGVSLGFNIN